MKKEHSRHYQLDVEKCTEMSGGNRFDLVIMAAARAREISRKNVFSDRFEHKHPAMTALLDFQEGRCGPEYIKRIR
jgi:DNA-directed RNA polymerase omega subunit